MSGSSSSQRITGPLVKLVLFAVATVILTAMLATTIASVSFGERVSYQARFSDVTGLLEGDDVRIAGVRVGSVEDIRIVERRHAQVTFSVDKGVRLAQSVRAKIRYRNLVGQRYVALTEGTGSANPLSENQTIPLSQTEPALDLTILFNGFRPLFTALDPKEVNAFAYEIIQVLQGESGTVESLLTRTSSLTNTLADRDQVIGRVIDNLNGVLGAISTRDQELSRLILQLQRFVSGLAADRQAIGSSLANIAGLADATAGLVSDVRPSVRADVVALGKVAGTLDASRSIVEGVLQRLPTKLRALTRTASYGSWFNFYLCQVDGAATLPVLGRVSTETLGTSEKRCQ